MPSVVSKIVGMGKFNMLILASEKTYVCAVSSALIRCPFPSPAGLSAVGSPGKRHPRGPLPQHTRPPSALTLCCLLFYSAHPFEHIIKGSYFHLFLYHPPSPLQEYTPYGGKVVYFVQSSIPSIGNRTGFITGIQHIFVTY